MLKTCNIEWRHRERVNAQLDRLFHLQVLKRQDIGPYFQPNDSQAKLAETHGGVIQYCLQKLV